MELLGTRIKARLVERRLKEARGALKRPYLVGFFC